MNEILEVDLDRIDRKILAILQTDGRISNLRLADQVALSPTAVQARVTRLTRDGYILGYEARLNPRKLGVGMTVFVEVLLDRTTPHVFDEFKAQARGDIPPAEPANDSQGPVQHTAARNGRPIQQKGRAPWAKQQGESTPKKTDSGKSINGGRVSDFANAVLQLKAKQKAG